MQSTQASGTHKQSVAERPDLLLFDLRAHFRFVSGGEIGIQKSKQIEGLVAKGLVSTSSIMVGDRDVDMIAAHRNGLQAAGVLWGFGSLAELEKEQPHYLLTRTGDLMSLDGDAMTTITT